MMKLDLNQVKCKDFISDFKVFPSTDLDSEIEQAIKDFSSHTIFRSCFSSVNINVLNFSNLTKSTLDQAEHIMLEIAKLSKIFEAETNTDNKIEIIQEIQE